MSAFLVAFVEPLDDMAIRPLYSSLLLRQGRMIVNMENMTTDDFHVGHSLGTVVSFSNVPTIIGTA